MVASTPPTAVAPDLSEDVPQPRRTRRWIPLVVLSAIVALAAAIAIYFFGKPSLQEFSDQADAVCLDSGRPLRELQASLSDLSQLLIRQRAADAIGLLDGAITGVQTLIDDHVQRFRLLDLPRGRDGEEAREFVQLNDDAANAAISSLKTMRAQINDGDFSTALDRLRDNRDVYDTYASKRDNQARRIGAEVCVRFGLSRLWGR